GCSWVRQRRAPAPRLFPCTTLFRSDAIEQARRDGCWVALAVAYELGHALEPHCPENGRELLTAWVFDRADHLDTGAVDAFIDARSEEHTSELQSREKLVWRLRPEKK